MLARIMGVVAAVMLLLAVAAQPLKALDGSLAGSFADIAVDHSTPEGNLRTFMMAVQRLIIRTEAREWARAHYDAWLYPPLGAQEKAEIRLLRDDVLDSMDLSAFPEWRRDSAGMETAFMLWEILQAQHVTKNSPFRKLREGLWTLPGSYVQMGTINSGMRLGDVVFTQDTIENVPALYGSFAARHAGPAFSPYRYLTETPGGVTPPRWAGVVHKLPHFLSWEFGSNTIFQWAVSAIILAAIGGIPMLLGRFIQNRSLRWFARAVITGLLAQVATGILIDQAGLSGAAATLITLLLMMLYYGAIVACVLIIGEWVGKWFSDIQEAQDETFDSSIIRLATRVVSVMTGLGILIYGLSKTGVPVFGIIAGFGVGGLAFALAAKPTLENILAGVILFLDGSIKVGDVIDSPPLSGTIVDIGMRSTRIRSEDGGLISVTNSELADKVIKNVSRRVTEAGGTKGA
ncbi:mechanosensitive ion channel family protein [Aestuariivirga sp.]|uniref:mechanosensitive ion channel family protein n=1 Tax=Aestuariivirga sp. TaxID=2650926 RepID=UPI003BAB2539